LSAFPEIPSFSLVPVFFADISTEMLYPILPIFLTQTLKASGSVVGLIDGFAGATQNVVLGFAGTLSDKLQRRKPIAEYFVLREKRWHRALFLTTCAPVASAGTTQQSGFYSLSQASSQAGFGIASGMWRCFTTGAALAVVGALSLWLLVNEIQDRRAHRAA
jgi:hypothetical protein